LAFSGCWLGQTRSVPTTRIPGFVLTGHVVEPLLDHAAPDDGRTIEVRLPTRQMQHEPVRGRKDEIQQALAVDPVPGAPGTDYLRRYQRLDPSHRLSKESAGRMWTTARR